MDGKVILLVDDDMFTRMVLRTLARSAGYGVVEAAGLEEVRRILEEDRPTLHVALVDLVLAGGERGEDVATLIRCHDIPVIAITGDAGAIRSDRVDQTGSFSAALLKPVDLTGLKATIDRVIRR